MQLIIQVVGIASMFCSIYSFQQNTHKKILALQLLSNGLFTVQYFFLGAWSGAVLNLLAVFRGMVFYNHGKKWADFKLWPVFFCLAFAVFGAFTYQLPLQIHPILPFRFLTAQAALIAKILPWLPVASMIINTFSFAAKKPATTRLTILFSSPGWIVYSFVCGSYGGFFNECFVIISAVVGIFRYDLFHSKNKSGS